MKTVIMINLKDEESTSKAFYHLAKSLPVVIVGATKTSLFYDVPACGCGFSLNTLKQTLAEVVAFADVTIGDIYEDGEVVFYCQG